MYVHRFGELHRYVLTKTIRVLLNYFWALLKRPEGFSGMPSDHEKDWIEAAVRLKVRG